MAKTITVKHFALPDGTYLGNFINGATPSEKNAVEIFPVVEPENGRDVYDFNTKMFIPYTPTYNEVRKKEYIEKLGDQGDQNDAIYKGVTGAIALMKEMGATDAQLQKHGLLPDKNAEPGTPAHWLGTIEDIKAKNPKPDKP